MTEPYFADATIVSPEGKVFVVSFRVDDGALSSGPTALDQVTKARTLGALIMDGFTIRPAPVAQMFSTRTGEPLDK